MSLRVVSEIAIVPESECNMPTLISAVALDMHNDVKAEASINFFILFPLILAREDALDLILERFISVIPFTLKFITGAVCVKICIIVLHLLHRHLYLPKKIFACGTYNHLNM